MSSTPSSPRTRRGPPGRRSGCRRARGSPPAAGWAADRADQAAQKGADFDALRPFRRAQQGGDEAALAIEDDDRLKAVFVVIGVEQAQLLAAVHRIEGVVDIQRDPPRYVAERAAPDVDQSPAQAQQRPRIGGTSSREMVDCEHRSLDGRRSSASLNSGSVRRPVASLPSS